MTSGTDWSGINMLAANLDVEMIQSEKMSCHGASGHFASVCNCMIESLRRLASLINK